MENWMSIPQTATSKTFQDLPRLRRLLTFHLYCRFMTFWIFAEIHPYRPYRVRTRYARYVRSSSHGQALRVRSHRRRWFWTWPWPQSLQDAIQQEITLSVADQCWWPLMILMAGLDYYDYLLIKRMPGLRWAVCTVKVCDQNVTNPPGSTCLCGSSWSKDALCQPEPTLLQFVKTLLQLLMSQSDRNDIWSKMVKTVPSSKDSSISNRLIMIMT